MKNKIFSQLETQFNNFDESVYGFLRRMLSKVGATFSNSQIYVAIFEAVKGVMQNMLFYIEDAMTEQNVFSASRRSSVYSLAKVSGYEPFYGNAATGTLNMTTSVSNGLSSLSTKIYMNNHTRLVNTNTGIVYSVFVNSNRYVFDLGSPIITHEIKAVQGNYVKSSYTTYGTPLEKISVSMASLFDKNYFDVYVNGEKWSQVGSLYDMTKDSKTYILTVGYENTFDVIFGNGVYGAIPPAGAVVDIYYVLHMGTSGNIHLNQKANFKFIDAGYDAFGNQVDINDYVNVEVASVISGGSDADTIDFVREMIGANSRSNVLASEDSYNLFFKRFSFIGYINCWCETNTMTVTAVCTNNVLDNISTYDEYYEKTKNVNNLLLNEDQKLMITTTLNNSNKAFLGMTLKFKDPDIRKFAIMCYIKIDDVYVKSSVKQNISDAFAAYFLNIKNNTQFIPKSDLITVALGTDENIKSIDITFISELAEQTYANGYYEKYVEEYIDGIYKYVKKKVFYEKDSMPGLDNYGNINLDSKFEIPVISGVRYYTDKEHNTKDFMLLEPIQFFFI